jgi:AcrR family transcriptional regulator
MQSNCNIAAILHHVSSDVNPSRDLHAARVARTQARIVAAARDLFLEQGYVKTTLAEVAERAGLAARTVYVRFGTKAALFRRVVDEALVGDAEPIDVEHRPRAQEAFTAATLAERLDALADVASGIADRAGALLEVASQAEGLEPELAQAAHAGREATAALCTDFWTRTRADGLVPLHTDITTLAVTTDLLVCADATVHLRRTRPWSSAQHGAWLRSTLATLGTAVTARAGGAAAQGEPPAVRARRPMTKKKPNPPRGERPTA